MSRFFYIRAFSNLNLIRFCVKKKEHFLTYTRAKTRRVFEVWVWLILVNKCQYWLMKIQQMEISVNIPFYD